MDPNAIPRPAMQPVASSNIKAVGYDPALLCLVIEFHNGAVYAYHPVEPGVHVEMLDAVRTPSVGKFFNARIRGREGITAIKLQDHKETV